MGDMSVLYGREGQREWAGGGPGEGKTHELVVFPSAHCQRGKLRLHTEQGWHCGAVAVWRAERRAGCEAGSVRGHHLVRLLTQGGAAARLSLWL